MSGPCCRFVLGASLLLVTFAVAHPAGPPIAKESRVDAVGDPLPDDALARFGTARFRDISNFYGIALSPDGKLLAIPGVDVIRLLDAATGKEAGRIKGENNSFSYGTITFSSDSKLLALANNSSVIVCDAVKAKVIGQFRYSGGIREGVSFSRDGKLLAVGGHGFREKLAIAIWDVVEKKEKTKIKVAYDREVHAILSPDGKTLATWGQTEQISDQSVLKLLDMDTGKERLNLKSEGYLFQQVVFSPDSKQMVTAEHGFPLSIRDVVTGKLLRRFAAVANTMVVMYSNDGAVLATGAANGTVQLWDAKSGRRLGQCKAPPRTNVTSIAFLPGNRALAAGFSHQMLRLWDVPSGRERTPAIGHRAAVSAVAFSRDGKKLVSAGADGVRIHALTTGKELCFIEPIPDQFGRIARRGNRSGGLLSPEGRHVVWCDQSGRGVTVIDLSSNEEIANVGSFARSFAAAVAFAPDGTGFATLGTEMVGQARQLTANVWDLESGLLRRKVQVKASGNDWSLALSPGGKVLALASSPISLWDVATGKEAARLPINFADHMVFSPDGSRLATSANGVVILWDAANGQQIQSLEGGANRYQNQILFSPDSRTLAVVPRVWSGDTDEIRLWELASGKVRATFPGHRGGTLSLAFSPDGRTLASGGTDTTVMLWDVTGVSAATRLHEGKPTAAQAAVLWAEIDSADARKAQLAMARLQIWPAETLSLFRKELKPAPGKPPGEKEVQRLIGELGDDSFETREKATKALRDLGLTIRPVLSKALAASKDLEKKRRLEDLLRTLRIGPLPGMIRLARALEVLERLATPEARRLVQTLAGGNPGARLTIDAKGVLKRMTRKP